MRSAAAAMACLALLGACGKDDPKDKTKETATDPPAEVRTYGGNVLVLLLDDIGVDKIRSYSPDAYGLPPQPTFDRLADEGVRFENAWVLPACTPTRAAALSGRFPHQTGLGRRVDFDGQSELQLGETTFAEVVDLGPHDYATGAFGKWHVASWVSEHNLGHPLVSGFDVFSGSMSNVIGTYQSWEKVEDGTVVTETVYATTDNVDDTLAFIEEAAEPWLVYLNPLPPHEPVEAPPQELTTIPDMGPDSPQYDQYMASIEAIDTELARLMDTMDPDVLASTTILMLGDNGTAGWAVLPPFNAARAKNSMFDGGIRVPFIVWGPFVEQPGSVTQTLTTSVDLWPTIADIAEVDLANLPDDDRQGISLLPWVVDPTAPPTRSIIYTEHTSSIGGGPYPNHQRAVRNDRWKLMVEEPGGNRVEVLYDYTTSDIDEGTGILATDPLTPEQEAVWAELSQAIDDLEAVTPYTPLL